MRKQNEDAAAVNTSVIPNPATTAQGPKFKTTGVTDRRRKKDKLPVLLKRFRKFNENYTLQLIRQNNGDVLKIKKKRDRKWVEVRGKKNFEINYDKNDKLHKTLTAIGKASNVSDLVNGETVYVNPKTPHGKKAIELLDGLYEDFNKEGSTAMDTFRDHFSDIEPLNENALKALRVATKAHSGQTRKSGGLYIEHPKEVARFVKQFKKSNNLSAMIQAAYLHDTLEDTDTTYADLVKQFGALVADMVQELTTDKVASDAIGKGEYIAGKMAKMSSWALVVKLADRLANVQDIDTRPADFQKRYADQTRLALKRLRADRFLSKTHNKIMTAIEKKIKEY